MPPVSERAQRVEVIGGGPGGLYVARVLRLRRPRWTVVVHEREPSEERAEL